LARRSFRLIPRDERFFEMLARSAEAVGRGAEALLELMEHYEDVERKVRRLKDIEHDGDEATHAIFDALNRSFITPFDRDDIGRLASARTFGHADYSGPASSRAKNSCTNSLRFEPVSREEKPEDCCLGFLMLLVAFEQRPQLLVLLGGLRGASSDE
jgi:hypothetical protein